MGFMSGKMRGRRTTTFGGGLEQDGTEDISIVIACGQRDTDGPSGKLIKLLDRRPWRPAHIHLNVSANGLQSIVT